MLLSINRTVIYTDSKNLMAAQKHFSQDKQYYKRTLN